ncbi:MBL fold metallo-hydrolase [Hoyosella rhizosphaerae]|uniref:Hydrolase n=1 Tax=Hoyosella rhizosphaerae TaxID=1755582 RepID=A0A916XH49_9ACTN|nr:MBL fold metallo-hydrolase [Hoyosella rhizosphaerae]MBN4925508.1 MBL fold metallo-hydrolase [Hoyosella rhizosphaerae]GGC70077.1 hydrolase [Hoyosella rhizosphaerae]
MSAESSKSDHTRGPNHVVVTDDYTGEPTVGGPAQKRTTRAADIYKLAVGPMNNNVYLVVCRVTGQALLIDAANEADRILNLVSNHAPNLSLIVTTHRHRDHWQALESVAAATGVRTAAHEIDAPALPVAPDRALSDGDVISIGELVFTVHHLRGHTPGSIALTLDTGDQMHLFTADNLFPGGLGKTANSHDFSTLYDDVTTKLFAQYPDSAHVYPGHGADTTIGAQRPQLGDWRERGW